MDFTIRASIGKEIYFFFVQLWYRSILPYFFYLPVYALFHFLCLVYSVTLVIVYTQSITPITSIIFQDHHHVTFLNAYGFRVEYFLVPCVASLLCLGGIGSTFVFVNQKCKIHYMIYFLTGVLSCLWIGLLLILVPLNLLFLSIVKHEVVLDYDIHPLLYGVRLFESLLYGYWFVLILHGVFSTNFIQLYWWQDIWNEVSLNSKPASLQRHYQWNRMEPMMMTMMPEHYQLKHGLTQTPAPWVSFPRVMNHPTTTSTSTTSTGGPLLLPMHSIMTTSTPFTLTPILTTPPRSHKNKSKPKSVVPTSSIHSTTNLTIIKPFSPLISSFTPTTTTTTTTTFHHLQEFEKLKNKSFPRSPKSKSKSNMNSPPLTLNTSTTSSSVGKKKKNFFSFPSFLKWSIHRPNPTSVFNPMHFNTSLITPPMFPSSQLHQQQQPSSSLLKPFPSPSTCPPNLTRVSTSLPHSSPTLRPTLFDSGERKSVMRRLSFQP